MKIFIVLALAVAVVTAFTFDLRENEIEPRNIEVPVKVPEGRIINGNDAATGQFPYQVGISSFKYGDRKLCGGSLVNSEWVLTAAHCTDGVQKVVVRLGSTIRNAAEVNYTIYKDDIIIHPKWNPVKGKNDISLIKIPATSYSSTINSVKLPSIAKSNSSYDGENAIATGWGLTYENEKAAAKILQYGLMRIVSNTYCRKYPFKFLTSTNICVSTLNGVSTCHGDSGGPLVLATSEELVGITSFGHEADCKKGYPAVFTRVTKYLDWIEEYTGVSQ